MMGIGVILKQGAGLVPKKVPIHREGKIFQAIRWVRPEDIQESKYEKETMVERKYLLEGHTSIEKEIISVVIPLFPKGGFKRISSVVFAGDLYSESIGKTIGLWDGSTVKIDSGLSSKDKYKVLIHELSHSMSMPGGSPNSEIRRRVLAVKSNWDKHAHKVSYRAGYYTYNASKRREAYEKLSRARGTRPISEYALSNSDEYWACSVEAFFTMPDKLRKLDPDTYKILGEIF